MTSDCISKAGIVMPTQVFVQEWEVQYQGEYDCPNYCQNLCFKPIWYYLDKTQAE